MEQHANQGLRRGRKRVENGQQRTNPYCLFMSILPEELCWPFSSSEWHHVRVEGSLAFSSPKEYSLLFNERFLYDGGLPRLRHVQGIIHDLLSRAIIGIWQSD